MANFKPDVLKKILANEGGYVNDPLDAGGETWAGVARNSHPKWIGWTIVDAIKKANPIAAAAAKKSQYKQLNSYLFANARLAELVAELYEAEYWDINGLDNVVNQQLAANVCDCGVNCGTFTGARMLQRAYNALKPTSTLVEDGKIGAATLRAVNAAQPIMIYNAYNNLRKEYYDAIIERRPTQIKYKASWYSRIVPYKA